MTTTLSALLRVVDHVNQLAGVFLGGAYIDQATSWILETAGYIITKSPDCFIHWLRMIRRRLIVGNFLRHRALFCLPLTTTTIHDLHILVTIHGEQPERIAGIPVVLITIEDYRCIVANPPTAHKLLEFLLMQKVAGHLILYIDMPVELDSSRNVANFVEQDIFINLDQADTGIVEMFGNPNCLYQHLWMGITRRGTHAGRRCFCSRHL